MFLFPLHRYPKFQASSYSLWLSSLVCVRPGRKSWSFSHLKVHFFFHFSDPLDIEAGVNIKNEKGKSVGKFRNRTGLYGLGLMRVGEIEGRLTVTNRQGQTVSVRAHKPSWWPEGS